MINPRRFINQNFIENNPTIVDEIKHQYKLKGRPESVLGRGILIAGICIKHKVLHSGINNDDKARSRLIYPESLNNQPISMEQWIEKIVNAEVVIFDAWYVLVQPLVDENELAAFAETVTGRIGLQACIGYGQQISDEDFNSIQDLRCDLVIDNEFTHKLFDKAVALGKQIYVVDNLEYVSKKVTRRALERFGYRCELIGLSSIHKKDAIYISTDIKDSYKAVNSLGNPYRAWVRPNIITNIYDNIVNLHIHGSNEKRDIFYEYGYICGGILAAGYCQYLNRLAKEKDIDKFIFVARDCYIIHQVYNRYFKEVDNEYFVTSRFSALEVLFGLEPMEYINENIRRRCWRKNADNSIRTILKECDLGILEKHLVTYGLEKNEDLNEDNLINLTDLILDHKDEISDVFADSRNAAVRYLDDTVGKAKRVAVVDIGWRGRSYMYIKRALKNLMSWQGMLTGVLIGVWDNPTTLDYIREDEIRTFAFENTNSRNCGSDEYKPLDEDEIICIEALFSSEADTLLRYKNTADGNVDFIFGKKNDNRLKINQIHTGIMDFCDSFVPIITRYGLTITPRDAYTPLDSVMRNKTLKKMIRDAYKELPGAINGF